MFNMSRFQVQHVQTYVLHGVAGNLLKLMTTGLYGQDAASSARVVHLSCCLRIYQRSRLKHWCSSIVWEKTVAQAASNWTGLQAVSLGMCCHTICKCPRAAAGGLARLHIYHMAPVKLDYKQDLCLCRCSDTSMLAVVLSICFHNDEGLPATWLDKLLWPFQDHQASRAMLILRIGTDCVATIET